MGGWGRVIAFDSYFYAGQVKVFWEKLFCVAAFQFIKIKNSPSLSYLCPMLTVKKITQLTGHNASVFALAQGSTDRRFISGSGDGWVVEWTLDDREYGKLIAKTDSNIYALHSLPDSGRVVAGNMHGGVHWVHLEEEERTKNVQNHEKGVFALQQVGDFLYSTGGGGMLTKWSLEKERTVESLQLSNQSLRGLAYAEKRGEIAVGASDNSIYILEAESMEIKQKIETAHDNSVFAVRYSADEKLLYSGGRDANLKVWNAADNYRNLSAQNAHWYTVNTISLHPEGHIIATGSRDKTIRFWDARTFKLLKGLDTIRDGCHVNSVNALLWLPDGTLVSGSDDRSLILWEVR